MSLSVINICRHCSNKLLCMNQQILIKRSIVNTSYNLKQLSRDVQDVKSELTLGQKAKEATKTTYYTGIVVVGFGALGILMYTLFKELFASFSVQNVYSTAVEKVTVNTDVIEAVGEPIKFGGELSRRGRRRHVTNIPYQLVDGTKGLRIKFYVRGGYSSGQVHADARTTSKGWEFRYIFVQMDNYPHKTMIVEDNRSEVDSDRLSMHSETDSLR